MEFIDQLGDRIVLRDVPRRIVSLVPSQSEFLWDLGLHEELSGVTRFCIHPSQLKSSAAVIGGTKKLDIKKIIALQPDLVIGNREENDQEQINELKQLVPVWMSDIITLEDAYAMMTQVGAMTGKEQAAGRIVSAAREGLEQVKGLFGGKKVAYFIWKKPAMLAASGTFIDEMLKHLGCVNVAGDLTRYPEATPEQLIKWDPSFLLLSSEPYPFKKKDAEEFEKMCPAGRPLLVDGEMFSWYGSRLLKAPAYMKELERSMV